MITTPSPEGDALRAAVRDLIDRFPDLDARVLGRLNAIAHRHDVEADLAERRDALAHQRVAAAMDTRGRWVRRAQGSAGPGVPGLGHIATPARQGALNAAEGMCGATLRGSLDWGFLAVETAHPDPEWRACRTCLRVLDLPTLKAVA